MLLPLSSSSRFLLKSRMLLGVKSLALLPLAVITFCVLDWLRALRAGTYPLLVPPVPRGCFHTSFIGCSFDSEDASQSYLRCYLPNSLAVLIFANSYWFLIASCCDISAKKYGVV